MGDICNSVSKFKKGSSNPYFDAGNYIIILKFWSCCLQPVPMQIFKYPLNSVSDIYTVVYIEWISQSCFASLDFDQFWNHWNQHWKGAIQRERGCINREQLLSLFTQAVFIAKPWWLRHPASNRLVLMDGTNQFCIFYQLVIWVLFIFNRLASYKNVIFTFLKWHFSYFLKILCVL